jgi:hypothetical protein
MKRLCGALVLAGMMLVAGGARADEFSVQTLYQECTAPDAEEYKQMYCLGVMAGVTASADTMAYTLKDLAAADIKHLLPWSACGARTVGAVRQAFINWAPKHPEKWNWPFYFGVMAALTESWPCVPPYK